MIRKFLISGVVIAFALAGGSARARDGSDSQDRAREAVRRGEVMPIAQILSLVPQHMSGDIVSIDLETIRGRLVYEVRVLTPQGRVREIRLDARTGALVPDSR